MKVSCWAAFAAFCLSACGSSNTAAAQSVDLQPMPVVSATVSWNPSSQILVAQLSGTGLAPGVKHGLAANSGGCSNPEPSPVQFSSLGVNDTGALHQTLLSSSAVSSGIASGSLQLLDGSGSVIACANLTGDSTVQFQPWPPYASGSLLIAGNTIQLLITGLPPKTTHGVGIYSGRCDVQGALLHKLKDLTADSNGSATGSDTLALALGPNSYLLVHAQDGDHLYNGDGSPDVGFTPVLCANLS